MALKRVRMTVNVDSRGSRGPSQMFETSRGNAWLVSLMARTLERPVTSSLYYEVYKRMPNDTDFTVTRTIAAGVNFANTAAIENYHTPLDTLAVADLGTLQHHALAKKIVACSHQALNLLFGRNSWLERTLVMLGMFSVAGQLILRSRLLQPCHLPVHKNRLRRHRSDN